MRVGRDQARFLDGRVNTNAASPPDVSLKVDVVLCIRIGVVHVIERCAALLNFLCFPHLATT